MQRVWLGRVMAGLLTIACGASNDDSDGELTDEPASCTAAEAKCSMDEQAPTEQDPLVAACLETCQRYEASCGVTYDCPFWCDVERFSAEQSGCTQLARSTYECGRTAAIDCSQEGLWQAVEASCGIRDLLVCSRYQGASCGRVEAFDSYCADALPELPEAFECQNGVPYGACADHPTYGSVFRCCPAGSSF